MAEWDRPKHFVTHLTPLELEALPFDPQQTGLKVTVIFRPDRNEVEAIIEPNHAEVMFPLHFEEDDDG